MKQGRNILFVLLVLFALLATGCGIFNTEKVSEENTSSDNSVVLGNDNMNTEVQVQENKVEPYLHEPSSSGNTVRFADEYGRLSDWARYEEGCWWEIEEDEDSREVRRTMYNSKGNEQESYRTTYAGIRRFRGATKASIGFQQEAKQSYLHYYNERKISGWEIVFSTDKNIDSPMLYKEYESGIVTLTYEFEYEHS